MNVVSSATIPPARYQKWVAAPIADIQAAIERGEGMFAVKDRAAFNLEEVKRALTGRYSGGVQLLAGPTEK